MNRADARQVAELELSRLQDLYIRHGRIPTLGDRGRRPPACSQPADDP